MEAHPPYLFGGAHGPGPGLSVVGDVDAAVIEVAVRGRWSRQLSLDVHTLLRKCMAEHPSAIIVDLGGLSDLDAGSAPTWLAASRAANALEPPAQLVLSLPPTRQLADRLRRLGAIRFLPIFVTMRQARVAVAGRLPLTDRLHLARLRPEAASVTMTRDLVVLACEAWDLPELAEPAARVMAALVSNAVEHAGTELAVTVSRRGTGCYLAVRDRDPRLPRLPGPPGGGLRTVQARTRAWGVMAADNGKIIWAIVRSGESLAADRRSASPRPGA